MSKDAQHSDAKNELEAVRSGEAATERLKKLCSDLQAVVTNPHTPSSNLRADDQGYE
jgi:hypothetical protein